ncbi:hypothetical protein D3C76_102640 [compost metagenome]
MKVFLGGTCNGSKWRETLIPLLECDYFNPVVEDWTPECMDEELKQRAESDIVLYVITPYMTGVFSIAEVIDDSNKRPNKTILCILEEDGKAIWSAHQFKSLSQVARMAAENGVQVFNTLGRTAEAINLKVQYS